MQAKFFNPHDRQIPQGGLDEKINAIVGGLPHSRDALAGFVKGVGLTAEDFANLPSGSREIANGLRSLAFQGKISGIRAEDAIAPQHAQAMPEPGMLPAAPALGKQGMDTFVR